MFTVSPAVHNILIGMGLDHNRPAWEMMGAIRTLYGIIRPAESKQIFMSLAHLDAGRFSSVRKYYDHLVDLVLSGRYRVWMASTFAGAEAVRGIAESEGSNRKWWDWTPFRMPEEGMSLAVVLLRLADLARAEELWKASHGC